MVNSKQLLGPFKKLVIEDMILERDEKRRKNIKIFVDQTLKLTIMDSVDIGALIWDTIKTEEYVIEEKYSGVVSQKPLTIKKELRHINCFKAFNPKRPYEYWIGDR